MHSSPCRLDSPETHPRLPFSRSQITYTYLHICANQATIYLIVRIKSLLRLVVVPICTCTNRQINK